MLKEGPVTLAVASHVCSLTLRLLHKSLAFLLLH